MNKEERFKKIISENSDRIMRICKYYNPNSEDQKDMYQEVLVNIWKSLDSFRGDSAINTWVYRVAINTSLNYTGKVFKEMKLIVAADNKYLNSIIDQEEFNEKLQQEEYYNRLQAELNLLSVIDKSLISLVVEGLSMKDIANVIGITEPNVKVKLHRIKNELRTKLKSKEDEK